MAFILVEILISIAALYEIKSERPQRKVFSAIFILLSFMICFRYGQGSDYYAYEQNYKDVTATGSLLVNTLRHGEIGWYVLLVIGKRLGLSWTLFVAIVSAFMMFSIGRILFREAIYGCFSLLLFFPVYYLVYLYSAVRQGIALTIFLGYALSALLKKRYLKYYLLIVAATLFHSSAIILFLLPAFLWTEKLKERKYFLIFVPIVFALGASGYLNSAIAFFGAAYYLKTDFSVLGTLIRIITFSIIYFIHRTYCKTRDRTVESVLFDLYTLGFCIAMMLSFSDLISQRLTVYLKAIEILLVPLQFYSIQSKLKESQTSLAKRQGDTNNIILLTLLFVAIMNVQLIHNIRSFIIQGSYYSWVDVVNYPYISIFDKDAILNYRPYN